MVCCWCHIVYIPRVHVEKENDANALIYLLAYVIALIAAVDIHKGYVLFPNNFDSNLHSNASVWI